MKNLFRKKNIKLNKIVFGFICLLSVALFIDYVVMEIIADPKFAEVGFNNFLYSVTIFIHFLFILYHVTMVFWKKKTSSMLLASLSASYLVFFYIIRLCLIWY